MFNITILIGRLTKDVETLFPRNVGKAGESIAAFDIAVNGNKSHDDNKDVLFMSVKVLNDKRAQNCAKYLHKGSLVAVRGSLHQWVYTRKTDNTIVKGIEVLADDVEFLDPKPETKPEDKGKEKEPAKKEAAAKEAGL